MTPLSSPRTVDDITHEWTQALLPPGPALTGYNITTLLHALAGPRTSLERDGLATQDEICPSTSNLLLDDYRLLLGPDPLGRDHSTLTEHEWHYILQQRWTARGDQRPSFYIALAKTFGVDISITEPQPVICGIPILGDGSVVGDLTLHFTWIVELPKGSKEAICGDSVCGTMALAQDDASGFAELMRIFKILKPAHSEVYFTHNGVWVNE